MASAADAAELSRSYVTLLKTHKHPPDVEAAISTACTYYRNLNTALVNYLQGNKKPGREPRLGTPGRETRSGAWSRAEAEYFASITTVAAMLGVRHPSPTGWDPVQETRELVADRVGPLCNGWGSRNPHVIDTHHPALDCPIHPREETQ
jgi:hypothetical protein